MLSGQPCKFLAGIQNTGCPWTRVYCTRTLRIYLSPSTYHYINYPLQYNPVSLKSHRKLNRRGRASCEICEGITYGRIFIPANQGLSFRQSNTDIYDDDSPQRDEFLRAGAQNQQRCMRNSINSVSNEQTV